jgi:transposase
MVMLGIDAHKRTHTVVAVDEVGRRLGEKRTTSTTTEANLEVLRWADRFGPERRFAVEDCRHLSRRLEADLLAAGEELVRVPPKLMAHARDAARTYGKSDPIDALAIAQAALRNPDLPVARLDGPSRDLRLMVDHREDLVRDRVAHINRLRWHLHELDPAWDPSPRSLIRFKQLDGVAARLQGLESILAEICRDLVALIRELTEKANALERRIIERVRSIAPNLVEVAGVGALTAAKIVAEVAGVRRFRSKDAFARHNGTAPLPVWSGNKVRHRLSRTGNRQLNTAIHRTAVTQIRIHEPAKAYLERRMSMGNTKTEAIRALKRKLSDVVYRALLADAEAVSAALLGEAA